MANGRAEGRGPLVLPHQDPGGTAGLDRGRDREHVFLAEQHRQLQLVRSQLAELALVEIRDLECLERAVGVLLQHEQIEDADQIALDEIGQSGRYLPVELAAGELDHDPIDRTQFVDLVRFLHVASFASSMPRWARPTSGPGLLFSRSDATRSVSQPTSFPYRGPDRCVLDPSPPARARFGRSRLIRRTTVAGATASRIRPRWEGDKRSRAGTRSRSTSPPRSGCRRLPVRPYIR